MKWSDLTTGLKVLQTLQQGLELKTLGMSADRVRAQTRFLGEQNLIRRKARSYVLTDKGTRVIPVLTELITILEGQK